MITYTTRIIRYLSNDSIATRKILRQTNVIESLIKLMSYDENHSITIDAIASIGYLSYKDQNTKRYVRQLGGLPSLVRLLYSGNLI